MDFDVTAPIVLHWNYRSFTEFPLKQFNGEETEITDLYLKENLISKLPADIRKFRNLESLYLSGNDISELPEEISELKQLKCLDVSGNRLTSIPEKIAEITKLKYLILDENLLVELPLRLSELTSLQYLSVTDNKLLWLPQRPVHNYYHCELRFWRNSNLVTLPYSLWYHMFRDQQTRSVNIGCLGLSKSAELGSKFNRGRCKLKLSLKPNEYFYLNADVSTKHQNILEQNNPPSLLELCRRKFYQILLEAAKNCSKADEEKHNDCLLSKYYDEEINNNIDNGEVDNSNGNNYSVNKVFLQNNNYEYDSYRKRKDLVRMYKPADVLEDYYEFLPQFMKSELSNGPASRCENLKCKSPVFDYAFYEFCLGRIILIENTEEIILSAAFCSKKCAEQWKRTKSNIIPWLLI